MEVEDCTVDSNYLCFAGATEKLDCPFYSDCSSESSVLDGTGTDVMEAL